MQSSKNVETCDKKLKDPLLLCRNKNRKGVRKMSYIDRTVVLYHMELTLYKGRNIPSDYDLITELNKVLNYINKLDKNDRKINIKSQNKIVYLETFLKNPDSKVYNLQFVSAKYNQVREVIDTETLTSRGTLKRKKDGDKEFTHVSIIFEDNDNAICAFECNYNGIGMSKIVSYLNDMANKYYEEKNQTKFYRFDKALIPNEEFLITLSKMERISVATFVVDKEDLDASDFRDLANRKDIRDEIEIVVKPVRKGASIMKKTIEDYYNKKKRNHKIKRIFARGEGEKGKIYLDTEQMKTRYTIRVDTDIYGVVKSEDIFSKFENILLKYLNGEGQIGN